MWVTGHSRSLKMVPFDRPYTYSSILYHYLTLNNIVTLKSGLGPQVTQGHLNWCYSKAWVRFSIRLP